MYIQIRSLTDEEKEYLRERFSELLEGNGELKVSVHCDDSYGRAISYKTTCFEISEWYPKY